MDVPEQNPPPSFPNGWFKVCHSDQLGAEGVLPVHVAGHDLVVFRAESGRACVLDAHCPHLGAHLGVGGKVVGDTIQCPFHGWRWRGTDGDCIEVPYATCIPSQAKIGCWRVIEQNGLVLAWFHADRKPAAGTPERIPEVAHLDYSLFLRRRWTQELAGVERREHGVDLAALEALHGIESERMVRIDAGVVRSLRPTNARDAARGSRAESMATIRSFLFGPGLSLARVSGPIEAVSVQSLTPLAAGVLEWTHDYYLHRDSDRALAEAFFDDYAKAWALDSPRRETTPARPPPPPSSLAGGSDLARFRRRRRRSQSRRVDVSV